MKTFNKIINFFKSIFISRNKKEEQEKLNQLLSEIEIGEIIWAKRYKNEIQRIKIPKGHETGPYIVLGKCDKGLICSYGTSVEHDGDYIKINSKKYNMNKESYFKMFNFEIITPNSFINKHDILKQEDILKIFRIIKIKKNNFYTQDKQIKPFNIPLQEGDIINNGGSHLIVDVNDNKILCVPLYKATQYFRHNIQFKDFKTLDYSKAVWLDLNDNVEYINTANDNILIYTLRSYKEYLENQKKKTITQRGSIIRKDNQYYYVYGEEAQEWLIFEIFKNNNSNKEKIILDNQTFYTSYKDLKINKYDEFETIFIATENEMDNIKEQRKHYIKEQKNKIEKGTYFKIGDIIETKHYKDQRFIIIKVCSKTYGCLSINKLIQGIYDPNLVKQMDAKLSENQSVEGIKWLEEQKNFNLINICKRGIIEQIIKRQQYILNKLEQQKIEEQKKHNVVRGSVVTYQDKYYYVYGEEGQDWLIYEITKQPNQDLDEIRISDQIFYTDYKNIKTINKKEKMDVLLVADENEMDIIKKNKKLYIRYKEIKSEKNNKSVSLGKYVEMNNEIYYVITRINNIVACISENERGKTDCKMKYFNIEDVTVVREQSKVKKLK